MRHLVNTGSSFSPLFCFLFVNYSAIKKTDTYLTRQWLLDAINYVELYRTGKEVVWLNFQIILVTPGNKTLDYVEELKSDPVFIVWLITLIVKMDACKDVVSQLLDCDFVLCFFVRGKTPRERGVIPEEIGWECVARFPKLLFIEHQTLLFSLPFL